MKINGSFFLPLEQCCQLCDGGVFKLCIEPRAGIEFGKFVPFFEGHLAATVGGAIKFGVVENDGHLVFGEHDIAFYASSALLNCQYKGRHGVFRSIQAGSAMCNKFDHAVF